ncbi:phage tail protein [Amycolatopsis sp. PS_44_ISF1]|uniref:phage tail protein n=1 Tax=Amycolatopsis sp. PS_44_ISF1 TaxID=2974917 RepID=UPI0028DDCE05|nr:phage tail protein [Amycolatopsis sp. PS_44_ISF1]MDT8913128.1 phage tail protein [Amycolatopsis sp. PS_44_ISF1]MDT8916334.1 phage tail protein [Amycolatopsis sp. PS_44_ISF1]
MRYTAANSVVLSQGTAHQFVVRTGSRELGAWSGASDLEVKWDRAEHWVGDSDRYFKYAGVAKYEPVRFTRAADPVGTKAVQDWLNEVHSTGGVPEDGALQVVDATGAVVLEWTIREMFPINWKISGFDAGGAKVYAETLTVVHSGLLSAANQAHPA